MFPAISSLHFPPPRLALLPRSLAPFPSPLPQATWSPARRPPLTDCPRLCSEQAAAKRWRRRSERSSRRAASPSGESAPRTPPRSSPRVSTSVPTFPLALTWFWVGVDLCLYIWVWCVVLLAVLTYCINYKMSPADLVSNWEVYYLNRSAHP